MFFEKSKTRVTRVFFLLKKKNKKFTQRKIGVRYFLLCKVLAKKKNILIDSTFSLLAYQRWAISSNSYLSPRACLLSPESRPQIVLWDVERFSEAPGPWALLLMDLMSLISGLLGFPTLKNPNAGCKSRGPLSRPRMYIYIKKRLNFLYQTKLKEKCVFLFLFLGVEHLSSDSSRIFFFWLIDMQL